MRPRFLLLLLFSLAPVAPAAAENEAQADGTAAPALYLQHCASCHGPERYGGYAPPLYRDALARKDDDALAGAILEGLPNTQMPAFGEHLDEEQARALVAWVREPLLGVAWDGAAIAASREAFPPGPPRIPASDSRPVPHNECPAKPVASSHPLFP